MSDSTEPSEPSPSFRDELDRLEQIVRTLENPDVDLDEAIALFHEGVERLERARGLLAETELTVRKLVQKVDGTDGGVDLDD